LKVYDKKEDYLGKRTTAIWNRFKNILENEALKKDVSMDQRVNNTYHDMSNVVFSH